MASRAIFCVGSPRCLAASHRPTLPLPPNSVEVTPASAGMDGACASFWTRILRTPLPPTPEHAAYRCKPGAFPRPEPTRPAGGVNKAKRGSVLWTSTNCVEAGRAMPSERKSCGPRLMHWGGNGSQRCVAFILLRTLTSWGGSWTPFPLREALPLHLTPERWRGRLTSQI